MQPQRWDRASRLSALPLSSYEGRGFLLAVPCRSWGAGRDFLGKVKSLLSVLRGAVHPVLLWGGLFVILEQTAEVLLFDSPPWRALAHIAWRVLGP